MRVTMLSKACIIGQYQTKLTMLAAQPNIELTVIVPPSWRDSRGTIAVERKHTEGYELIVTPIRWNGHYHLHYYPDLAHILERTRPDIFHIDEEPYNNATYLAMRAMQKIDPKARIVFFTWQNIARRYPLPFSRMEQYVYRHSAAAIAGNREAEQVLRDKGYTKPIVLIPQFGVSDAFAPVSGSRPPDCVTIGYAGRLVREKGIEILLHAAAQVQGNWKLEIVGSGPLYDSLVQLAQELNIAPRVHFAPWVASDKMPQFYNSLDVLVVPSLTQANWKEQFGRVLMEAMASGVTVIGSDSGEIPSVVGDAGVVVPEGDVTALAAALQTFVNEPVRRAELGLRGRERAITLFSQQRVVDDTYALYQRVYQAR